MKPIKIQVCNGFIQISIKTEITVHFTEKLSTLTTDKKNEELRAYYYPNRNWRLTPTTTFSQKLSNLQTTADYTDERNGNDQNRNRNEKLTIQIQTQNEEDNRETERADLRLSENYQTRQQNNEQNIAKGVQTSGKLQTGNEEINGNIVIQVTSPKTETDDRNSERFENYRRNENRNAQTQSFRDDRTQQNTQDQNEKRQNIIIQLTAPRDESELIRNNALRTSNNFRNENSGFSIANREPKNFNSQRNWNQEFQNQQNLRYREEQQDNQPKNIVIQLTAPRNENYRTDTRNNREFVSNQRDSGNREQQRFQTSQVNNADNDDRTKNIVIQLVNPKNENYQNGQRENFGNTRQFLTGRVEQRKNFQSAQPNQNGQQNNGNFNNDGTRKILLQLTNPDNNQNSGQNNQFRKTSLTTVQKSLDAQGTRDSGRYDSGKYKNGASSNQQGRQDVRQDFTASQKNNQQGRQDFTASQNNQNSQKSAQISNNQRKLNSFSSFKFGTAVDNENQGNRNGDFAGGANARFGSSNLNNQNLNSNARFEDTQTYNQGTLGNFGASNQNAGSNERLENSNGNQNFVSQLTTPRSDLRSNFEGFQGFQGSFGLSANGRQESNLNSGFSFGL